MKYLLLISLIVLSWNCMAQIDDKEIRHKKKDKVKTFRVNYPDGMKYVPSGSFKMQGKGYSSNATAANTRLMQMTGFYMDATEVTNGQYGQFTNWVKDSIANTLVGDNVLVPGGSQKVEKKKINWNDTKVQQQLSSIYPLDKKSGERRVDVIKLVYRYDFFDYNAYKRNTKENPVLYLYGLEVPVYPDTSVLETAYSYNDPIARQYFSFQSFSNYPVVGVNLMQSIAYCDWRTKMWNEEHKDDVNVIESSFRIPTEEEWEWASRGGSNAVPPILQPVLGKNVPGNLIKETNKADNAANGYGLRNMAGQVSEWTISGAPDYYEEQTSVTVLIKKHDGTLPTDDANRKIVRGGNWRHDHKDRQAGVKFLYAIDSASAYIGFRCVFSQVFTGTKKGGN